jgi:ribonuclease HI/transposase InsO family protein
VIDTGASASFLPRDGVVIQGDRSGLTPTSTRTRVADNARLDCTHTFAGRIEIYAPHRVGHQDKAHFYVINKARTILGYDALIGTDLIKRLGISITPNGNTLEALIDDHVVGREDKHASVKMQLNAMIQQEAASRPLDTLLAKFEHVFADYAEGVMRTTPMAIKLDSGAVPKAHLRRQSPEDISEIKRQVDHMLERGVIEPSISQYSANCHLVPKKTGQKRLVINYIPLNRVAVKDHYPLPQVSDLLAHLSKAKYFCALDCTEGFWQIPVEEGDRHKTAFVTPHGMYQFRRCPFGFTNSPAVYQRAMNEIFADGLYSKCLIYIDDILVFGETYRETLDNLSWVLERCDEFDVKLKRSKCEFMKTEIKFLGYVIKANTVAPQRDKCDSWEAIKPICKRDAQSLLGSLNYYSGFIEHFTEKTKPIRLAIQSDPFQWPNECKQAQEDLLQELRLCEAHQIPSSDSPKRVEIGVLPNSIEACCTTMDNQLIRFTSAILSSTQQNYTSVEKELLALVRAYESFGPLLKGPVDVITTCDGLKRAIKLREKPERVTRILLNLPPDANFRIVVKNDIERALRKLQTPPQEVFYTDGACADNGTSSCRGAWAVVATMNPELSNSGTLDNSSNQKAEVEAVLQACKIAKQAKLDHIMVISDSQYAVNAVSKWINTWKGNGWMSSKKKPVENRELLEQLANEMDSLKVTAVHVKGHSGDKFNELADTMAKDALNTETVRLAATSLEDAFDQGGDDTLQGIKEKLASGQAVKNYVLKDDKVWYEDHAGLHLVIPSDKREILLRLAHEDPIYGAHQGIKKTRRKLNRYYWEGIYSDVERFVRSCNTCQLTKARRTKPYGLLMPIKTAAIFERLHIDVVGPVTETIRGNRYVVTMIDAFSRYGMARAFPLVSADDIVRFLYEEVIQRHGAPTNIVTDNGTQFKAERFQQVIKRLGINHSTTCEYHPQANGMDERFNATLMKLVRNHIDLCRSRWDILLPWATLAYNLIANESTRTSPYTILYGREPRGPLNNGEKESSADGPQHDAIREQASSNMEISRQDMERQYNRYRLPMPQLEMMDLVLTKAHGLSRTVSKKLWPKWTGPHFVMKVIKHDDVPVAVEVLDVERFKTKRVPFADIRLYKGDSNRPERDSLPGDRLMEVSELLHDLTENLQPGDPMPSGERVASLPVNPGDETIQIETGLLDRELENILSAYEPTQEESEGHEAASEEEVIVSSPKGSHPPTVGTQGPPSQPLVGLDSPLPVPGEPDGTSGSDARSPSGVDSLSPAVSGQMASVGRMPPSLSRTEGLLPAREGSDGLRGADVHVAESLETAPR